MYKHELIQWQQVQPYKMNSTSNNNICKYGPSRNAADIQDKDSIKKQTKSSVRFITV